MIERALRQVTYPRLYLLGVAILVWAAIVILNPPDAFADYWCRKVYFSGSQGGWVYYWTICSGNPPPIYIHP